MNGTGMFFCEMYSRARIQGPVMRVCDMVLLQVRGRAGGRENNGGRIWDLC